MNNPVDIKSKLYASGVVPHGTPSISLSDTSITMSKFQSGKQVVAHTQWDPVTGNYVEEYSWTNLGPLEDYDFGISKSLDTTTATIRAYDTTGTTTVRVLGMTSGVYSLFTLTIS
jgi:hypothetical protein